MRTLPPLARCAAVAAAALALAAVPGAPGAPVDANAQIMKKIKKAAGRAATREAEQQTERAVRDAIRCAIDDPRCAEEAEAEGSEVVFVDEEGNVIADADGQPVASRDEAMAVAMPAPGEGIWANYDFVPGDEILFFDDFAGDEVGDFPRRWTLVQGNWEIVEWQGDRYLRANANGAVAIPLPANLPEQFTVEVPVHLTHGNSWVRITSGRAYYSRPRSYEGHAMSVERARAGLRPIRSDLPQALSALESGRMGTTAVPFRVMVDGGHMKAYLGERRVANVPNGAFPRTDTLFIAVSSASESQPVYLGAVRIAAGGRDLYDRLARDGRVATQGIYFATDSDRLRPESTPTLEEIGAMLKQHPGLRLRIEGHTDAEGEAAYNKALSERRAASVKAHLVKQSGIDAARLEAAGFGESRPAADNATPEGRQANRRVELVRLDK